MTIITVTDSSLLVPICFDGCSCYCC